MDIRCKVVIIIQLLLIAVPFFVFQHDEKLFRYLTAEDSFYEWLTAIIFIGTAALCAIRSYMSFKKSLPNITILLFAIMAIGSFIVGMEEISWGQRVFSLKTPEAIRAINTQGELNIHNILNYWSTKVCTVTSFFCRCNNSFSFFS